eukprot:jgi/Mesvir1/26657/Mv20446-RA.1
MAGEQASTDPYQILGVSRTAKTTEIRRAYRNLVTKEHPDKGGNPVKFNAIQRAYDLLSDDEKRRQYDTNGRTEKSVEEELLDSFGGGKFRDRLNEMEEERANMAEQLAVRQSDEFQSHSHRFEAWLRSRGDGTQVITEEDIAEKYGVSKASYEAVPLPPIKAYTARVTRLGRPVEVVELSPEAIPSQLEWGEVLINMQCIPINPQDLYSCMVGRFSLLDGEDVAPPFIGGNDGVGTVMRVGPGCKMLLEGDWVIPAGMGLGTWRSLGVFKEKDLYKLPADLMPVEHCAMLREMCVAYRLLEDFGNLKPGDGVILNAANSTVGRTVVQLCSLLKLRTIALVRPGTNYDKIAEDLKAMGATEVFEDQPGVRQALDERKLFAKPKLALDAVGGASAARMADCLHPKSPLIIYGCMSGKSPNFPWQTWLGKDLKVQGFALRRWMKENKKRVPLMFETLAKLVHADKIKLNFTEYELATEFGEAMEHACEEYRNTKVLLRVNDVGVTY